MFNIFKKQKDVMEMTVPEFAHAHPDLLIIVCDPKTDNIFVGHNDAIVSGKIKSLEGTKMHVVKDVLQHSQFAKSIDPFLTGVLEVLKLPLKAGNQFYQFLDGALFNISKALRKDKPQPGAIPSPFIKEYAGRNK